MVSEPPFAFLPWTPQMSEAGALRVRPRSLPWPVRSHTICTCHIPTLLQLSWLPHCPEHDSRISGSGTHCRILEVSSSGYPSYFFPQVLSSTSSLHPSRSLFFQWELVKCSVQFSLVPQSCPTLSDPMDCSTPGLPVHHQLPELTQTHVHRVSDAIQPSSSIVPFSSCLQPFPASEFFPVSQFFASGGQSIGVSASASVLPMNIQDWFYLGLTGWISLQSKGLSKVFNTTAQKHQFFCAQPSSQSNSHNHTWPQEKP